MPAIAIGLAICAIIFSIVVLIVYFVTRSSGSACGVTGPTGPTGPGGAEGYTNVYLLNFKAASNIVAAGKKPLRSRVSRTQGAKGDSNPYSITLGDGTSYPIGGSYYAITGDGASPSTITLGGEKSLSIGEKITFSLQSPVLSGNGAVKIVSAASPSGSSTPYVYSVYDDDGPSTDDMIYTLDHNTVGSVELVLGANSVFYANPSPSVS